MIIMLGTRKKYQNMYSSLIGTQERLTDLLFQLQQTERYPEFEASHYTHLKKNFDDCVKYYLDLVNKFHGYVHTDSKKKILTNTEEKIVDLRDRMNSYFEWGGTDYPEYDIETLFHRR